MDLRSELLAKVRTLIETVWVQADIKQPDVDEWLSNFSGDVDSAETEQLHALFLLSHFMYFDVPRFRELLRVVYRDLYRYPIIQKHRKAHGNTKRFQDIEPHVAKEIQATRFIGMGRPSESGSLLLYLFRQSNDLDVKAFLHSHEIFSRTGTSQPTVRDPSIRHYVFIDDLCGTGKQACDYSKDLVDALKRGAPGVEVSYFVLFATDKGLKKVRNEASFDRVECVFQLDPSFKAFAGNSRVFAGCPPEIDKAKAEDIFRHYGSRLWPKHPLGYRDSQLLLGFWHNVPDNTLPTIWADGGHTWSPIFERHHKLG